MAVNSLLAKMTLPKEPANWTRLPCVQMALQTEKNIWYFIADTQIQTIFSGNISRGRCRDSCSLQLIGGSIADQNYFGDNL